MKVIFAESHNLDRPDPLGSHQYIRLFKQEGAACLWLGPAITPLHLFKPDFLNRNRFRVWREGGRRVEGIDWLVPLSFLFYYDLPLLRSLYSGRNQYRFCLPPLPRQLARFGFAEADLLWCAGPAALSLLDLVPHALSCYRLADRLDQFSRIPANVTTLQRELIERVDFVLTTSLSLYDWARQVRSDRVYYLPNGVGEIFFKQITEKPRDFPADGRPVAVYLGTLDTRFDMESFSFAVKKLPAIHFLLIGPLTDERLKPALHDLQQFDNCTWLGPRRQADAPAYLQHSAVGLIPFYINELTEAVNPLKYYEYLACGLPVVAPPMRELTTMRGPLYSYREREELCAVLQQAVTAEAEERRKNRDFAAGHTWTERFTEICAIMEELKDSGAGESGG